jgi:hypothetical protein
VGSRIRKRGSIMNSGRARRGPLAERWPRGH